MHDIPSASANGRKPLQVRVAFPSPWVQSILRRLEEIEHRNLLACNTNRRGTGSTTALLHLVKTRTASSFLIRGTGSFDQPGLPGTTSSPRAVARMRKPMTLTASRTSCTPGSDNQFKEHGGNGTCVTGRDSRLPLRSANRCSECGEASIERLTRE